MGEYSFAIWDCEQHRLFCVRDRFGVKPFYYHRSERLFIFGSSARALVTSGEVLAVFNEGRIADFLMDTQAGTECLDKASTFYQGISRLEPAHTLIVRRDQSTERRYWEPAPAPGWANKSHAEYLEAFLPIFTEAVRCRTLPDASPAAMLSGGLDSSSIVAVSRKIRAESNSGPLPVFAAISNESDSHRETIHIRAVVNQGGLEPHLISEDDLRRHIPEILQSVQAEEEPFDCLMNLQQLLYLEAKAHGVRTVLDGVDGDVLLIDPYAIYPQLWRQGNMRIALRETLGARGVAGELGKPWRLFLWSLRSALAPDWIRAVRRRYRYGIGAIAAAKKTIINGEFARRVDVGRRLATRDSHGIQSGSCSILNAHKTSLDHPCLTVGVERYQRVAASLGIEASHPLLDVRLVEFCLSLPWRLQTQGGWTKLILRRLMEPSLPSEVVWRRDKDSLAWHFNAHVLREQAGYFTQLIREQQNALEPYLDIAKILRYCDAFSQLGDERNAEVLWYGAALALWLHQQAATSPLAKTA